MSAASSRPFLGKLLVLVDDHALVRAATETMLKTWGCEVVSAESLRGVREQLGSGRHPDALIVDYRLQDALGTDVIRALRNDYGLDIPAVILTGEATSGMLASVAKERLAYLEKPLMPQRLRNAVATLLGLRD